MGILGAPQRTSEETSTTGTGHLGSCSACFKECKQGVSWFNDPCFVIASRKIVLHSLNYVFVVPRGSPGDASQNGRTQPEKG